MLLIALHSVYIPNLFAMLYVGRKGKNSRVHIKDYYES